jgi:hypothetical protein
MMEELAGMANFPAACTGMRIGEAPGLRGEFMFADFIRVQGAVGEIRLRPRESAAPAETGIDGEEQKRRNLTPHAWRYFLNAASC